MTAVSSKVIFCLAPCALSQVFFVTVRAPRPLFLSTCTLATCALAVLIYVLCSLLYALCLFLTSTPRAFSHTLIIAPLFSRPRPWSKAI